MIAMLSNQEILQGQVAVVSAEIVEAENGAPGGQGRRANTLFCGVGFEESERVARPRFVDGSDGHLPEDSGATSDGQYGARNGRPPLSQNCRAVQLAASASDPEQLATPEASQNAAVKGAPNMQLLGASGQRNDVRGGAPVCSGGAGSSGGRPGGWPSGPVGSGPGTPA